MPDGPSASITEIWRYPVKSMGGERIDTSDVTEAGLVGDRRYAVVDPATGKVGSAKHPRLWGALLQCRARYVAEQTAGKDAAAVAITLPDGTETRSDDPRVDDRLSAVFGRPVRLTTVAPEANGYLAVWPEIDGVMPAELREQTSVGGEEADGTLTALSLAMASPAGTFFDVSALHVVTAATLRHLGTLRPGSRFAVERFRPNAIIDGPDSPWAENEWGGATLRFGSDLTAAVLMPTMRCIMTTLAQGDLPRDSGILRTLTEHNRVAIPGIGTWSCVGAYAVVTAAGRLGLGDEVEIRTAPVQE